MITADSAIFLENDTPFHTTIRQLKEKQLDMEKKRDRILVLLDKMKVLANVGATCKTENKTIEFNTDEQYSDEMMQKSRIEEYLLYILDSDTCQTLQTINNSTVNCTLFSIGQNDYGQLGISNNSDHEVYYESTARLKKVELLNLTTIVCGSCFVAGIDVFGKVWTWGFNECTGNPKTSEAMEWKPSCIPISKKVVQIACGESITVALQEDGVLCYWGYFRNPKGEKLGLSLVPKILPGPNGIIQISAGENHAACVTKCGKSYTWGTGDFGQLGRPFLNSREEKDLVPTMVHFPPGIKCNRVWAVGFHTFWMTNHGLYGCGKNGYGELGLNSLDMHIIPTFIPFPSPIIKVVGGLHHVLFLDSKGQVWATGSNIWGQCSIDDQFTTVPMKINLENIVDIACGKSGHHSYAVDAKARLYTTGQNCYGQLMQYQKQDADLQYFEQVELKDWRVVCVDGGALFSTLLLTKD